MHRKASRRVLTVFAGLVCTLALTGCKPDIPLIPFVKGDTYPATTSVRASDAVFFDGSTSMLISPD